jgi:type I restriction enzyme S subunit
MNEPALRFKKDDGQTFPEWEEVLLKDIAERVKNKNKEDNKNVLTISAQQGLINQEEYFNKSVAAKDLTNYYLLHKGDFAYNKSYSNGYPMGAIKCLKRYEKGVVSTLYICFKFHTRYVNAFFEQYFEAGLHNKEIEKVAQEGARNHGLLNIGLDDFFSILLTIPSVAEQTKIANFLTAVDEKITHLTKKYDLLTQYKKGVMQQIFSQELRFKDDDGRDFPEWKELELGDAAEILMGQSPDSNSYNDEEKGVPLVQGNADITNRRTNPRAWTTAPTKQCVPNDIILTVRAPVGAVAISDHIACIGRGVCAIRNNDKAVSNYIYQLLLWYEPTKWNSLEQGSTFTAVSGKDIKTIDIPFPTLKEQTKIANFLTSIDDKITATKAQLNAVKQYKQGLLQQMFV